MNELIGKTAGEIWGYLSQKGESTIAAIKKDLELKAEETSMALGWLAREEKLDFIQKGTRTKIKLK